jgi:hypothetical protein
MKKKSISPPQIQVDENGRRFMNIGNRRWNFREKEDTVYGYTCLGCGASWKIYQKSCHYHPCSVLEEEIKRENQIKEELIEARKQREVAIMLMEPI